MNDLPSLRYAPAHWLQCAREVRVQAKELEDPEMKLTLEDIAARYDRLAERARYDRLAAWTEHLMSRPAQG